MVVVVDDEKDQGEESGYRRRLVLKIKTGSEEFKRSEQNGFQGSYGKV